MVNSRSPFFTSLPSLKWTLSRYPLTRARISTLSGASMRPIYSSHSTTSRETGTMTETTGGGGAVGVGCLPQPVSNRPLKSGAIRSRVFVFMEVRVLGVGKLILCVQMGFHHPQQLVHAPETLGKQTSRVRVAEFARRINRRPCGRAKLCQRAGQGGHVFLAGNQIQWIRSESRLL